METTRAKCPHCGQIIVMSVPVAQQPKPAKLGRWRALESATALVGRPVPMAAPAANEWQKVTPVGRLEPKDVTTAVYDAAVSFGLVTVGAGGLAWGLGWPWWSAPAGGFGVALWRYFGGIRLAQGLLETVETTVNRDLNRDGLVGSEPVRAEPEVVRVELREEGRWQFADLPGAPESLKALAAAVVGGESFSERTAAACGLSQEQFGKLRDLFSDRNWARWNHPDRRQQGVSLQHGGMGVMRAMLEAPLPVASDGKARAGDTHQHAARNDAGNWAFV